MEDPQCCLSATIIVCFQHLPDCAVLIPFLLRAILTIFQTDGSNEPVTRTTALISLVCALLSLVFGCVYILRFQTMRSMKKAVRWAEASAPCSCVDNF